MKIRVGLTDKMVLIGLGIAGVYWILDTILALFGHTITVLAAIFLVPDTMISGRV